MISSAVNLSADDPCLNDPSPVPPVREEAHGLFTEILQDYVFNGKVDYRNLHNDKRLDEYLAQLAAANPDTIADLDSRLAFWINAYNAYTLKIICDNYPLKSINDLHFGGLYIGVLLRKTVWDKKIAMINGEEISLNHIEHNIIRPTFGDPRAHFALVCASKSCPPLRSEAYEGYKLNEQLDEQGRIFFNETDNNYFELNTRTAHLSKILNWYEKDFGGNSEEVLQYVAQFLPEELARDIYAFSKEWKVEYTDYDWGLNEWAK
jgi:hypothetical protein